MVVKANKNDDNIGGHISTYASLATLIEVGQNHFFHGSYDGQPGDFIYYQGHASPGMYARAFVEGRLNEQHLENFRHELRDHPGLSSYPHPWLMPDFWQFPTVSMGLGPSMRFTRRDSCGTWRIEELFLKRPAKYGHSSATVRPMSQSRSER